ncbi:hypothetical protein D3C71_1865340 [compost metagenome]
MVPGVTPETDEERLLYETAPDRKEARKIRRQESKHFATFLGTDHAIKASKAQSMLQNTINKGYENAWDVEW